MLIQNEASADVQAHNPATADKISLLSSREGRTAAAAAAAAVTAAVT